MFVDHETRALLSRVVAGLGITLVVPACSPRLVIDGDDEAAEDESSEGESGMATESGTSSGDTDESSSSSDDADDASDSDESEEDTVTDWDIGPPPDAGGPCMGDYPMLFEIDTEIPERCLDPRNPEP